jgi:hypothetical protein
MRPKRMMLTRGRVTITVTLTLYAWMALNGAFTKRSLCGDAPVNPLERSMTVSPRDASPARR